MKALNVYTTRRNGFLAFFGMEDLILIFAEEGRGSNFQDSSPPFTFTSLDFSAECGLELRRIEPSITGRYLWFDTDRFSPDILARVHNAVICGWQPRP